MVYRVFEPSKIYKETSSAESPIRCKWEHRLENNSILFLPSAALCDSDGEVLNKSGSPCSKFCFGKIATYAKSAAAGGSVFEKTLYADRGGR